MWRSSLRASVRHRCEWSPLRPSVASNRSRINRCTAAERAGYWSGSGDAGVGGVDTVGGAEDGDLGHQLRPVAQQRSRPGRCGGVVPVPCCGTDLGCQLGDQLRAVGQVLPPARMRRERLGDGGQPAQRPDAGARRGLQAPGDHRAGSTASCSAPRRRGAAQPRGPGPPEPARPGGGATPAMPGHPSGRGSWQRCRCGRST